MIDGCNYFGWRSWLNRSWLNRCSAKVVISSVLTVLVPLGNSVASAQNAVQVRLKNGDFVTGSLVASQLPDTLGLQVPAFEEPIALRIDAISSVKRDEESIPSADDDMVFVLRNRSTLVGKLKALTDESITIQSQDLGELNIPRTQLSEWIAKGGTGKRLFHGPKGGQKWDSPTRPDAWKIEGNTLTTDVIGHMVRCEAVFPALCEVRINLAWNGDPGFMLALGSPEKGEDPGSIEAERSIVRLESWGKKLVMVRETSKKIEFVELGELSKDGGRLDLVLFIDRQQGTVVAYARTGKLLGKIALKDVGRIPESDRLIKLLNTKARKDALRLEGVDIRQWSGQLSDQSDVPKVGLVNLQNELLAGTIGPYDAETQSISLKSDAGSTDKISLSKIGRAIFSTDATLVAAPENCIEIQLTDGSVCIGAYRSAEAGKFGLAIEGLTEPLTATFDKIASLSGNSVREGASELVTRIGGLEAPHLKLQGTLANSTSKGELQWHAQCAAAPVHLRSDFEGKIEFEPSNAKATVQKRERVNANDIVANGFQFLLGNTRAAQPESPDHIVIAKGLKFRTGDLVDGQVERIDESGVTFKANDRTSTVPHDRMESVNLVIRTRIPELPPEKLKHLTTIPRASKADPPTHLFISSSGDYLRGRLVKYVDGQVTAEIRLENVEFPKDAIAQIYWLHSRDWDEKKPASQPDSKVNPDQTTKPTTDTNEQSLLQVHAMQRQDRAVTFTPTQLTKKMYMGRHDQVLKGHSELLGDCEVVIGQVTSLLIGRDVGALARKMHKDAWTLSVATLPKVYQEGEPASESSSELVGQAAPDFTLNTTDGAAFTLSKLKGRVTVLDFWASWCGPCMQTMPEVDRIVEEIGGDKVELVAVNLQETKERAEAAVKRLGLTATVVLDSDGIAAQKYQASAIPQTVIIDREGKVTHIFVGGGPRFLKQFEEALSQAISKP